MADQYNDPTTNYSWDLPEEEGDTNDWGRKLNDIFGGTVALSATVEGIDSVIKTVSDVADAAMPVAGGTFTGNVEFGVDCAVRENMINVSTSINWASGNFFRKALSEGLNDLSAYFTNYPPANTVQFITLHLVQPGAGGATVTWPTNVVWQDATAPTLSASGADVDVVVFYTLGSAGTPDVFGAHSLTALSP